LNYFHETSHEPLVFESYTTIQLFLHEYVLDKIATCCRPSLAVDLLANILYYYSCAYEIWFDTNKNMYTHFVWNVICTLTTTKVVEMMRAF